MTAEKFEDFCVAGKELFLVQNNSHKVYTLLNWEEYGLRITIPHDAVQQFDTVEVAITALVGGEFILPEDTELVSAVYAISFSKPLLKPVQLEIQHCVSIEKPAHSNYLSFATASSDKVSCEFQPVEGGEFSVRSRYGSIYITEFSCWSIFKWFRRRPTASPTNLPPSTLSPPQHQPSPPSAASDGSTIPPPQHQPSPSPSVATDESTILPLQHQPSPSPSAATDESAIPPPQHQPSPSPSAATDESTIPPPQHQPSPPSAVTDKSTIPPLQHQPSPSSSAATDESTLVLPMCQQLPPSSESSPSITVSGTTTASYNTAPTDLEGMYRQLYILLLVMILYN